MQNFTRHMGLLIFRSNSPGVNPWDEFIPASNDAGQAKLELVNTPSVSSWEVYSPV